jgi:hypothetical protein
MAHDIIVETCVFIAEFILKRGFWESENVTVSFRHGELQKSSLSGECEQKSFHANWGVLLKHGFCPEAVVIIRVGKPRLFLIKNRTN